MSQEMFLRKIPEDMRPWECNVNGVKYVYPAGTEQNVPAEVAHLIDAWYVAQEQESVPGGGGGDSRFVVNVTRDEDWKPSFDKTYEEIMEACLAGKEVVLCQGAVGYMLSGFDDVEGEVEFCSPGVPSGSYIVFHGMVIKRGGYWAESELRVNCTIEWSDTNEPSQSPT